MEKGEPSVMARKWEEELGKEGEDVQMGPALGTPYGLVAWSWAGEEMPIICHEVAKPYPQFAGSRFEHQSRVKILK